MTDIAGERSMIQQEETANGAAVSESTMSRVGAGINFINTRQFRQAFFGAVGPYGYAASSVPLNDFGSREIMIGNSRIIDIAFSNGTAGASGTSEFDIKWAAAGSSSFVSIFSTTPKISHTAADAIDWRLSGAAPSGVTNAVLAKTDFADGDQLRFDIIGVTSIGKDFIAALQIIPLT